MHNFFFDHQTLIEGDYKLADVSMENEIGHGNARVFAAHIDHKLYAIKQIQIKTDYQYNSFLKQISNLKEISQVNSYLIGYQGYFMTELNKIHHAKTKFAYIVMEYAQMNLGLFVSMKKSNPAIMSIQMIQNLIETLVRGFSQLESINIAHCDIKPENILVSKYSPGESMQAKICDVGSCKIVNSQSLQELTIYGTLPFLAPELIQIKSQKIISANPFRSDVFSFGLVVLYAITGKKFTSKERKQISYETYEQILNEWIKQGSELANNEPHISETLKQALQMNAFKRSTFKQLKILYDSYKRKKKMENESKIKKINREQSQKQNTIDFNKTKSPGTVTGRTTTTFSKRNRITNKFSSTALSKIKKRSPSNQSNKMKTSSSQFSVDKSKVSNKPIDIGPIAYVNKINKDFIPYDQIDQQNTIFVVSYPYIKFKSAKVVSVMSACPLSVFHQLAETTGQSLYLDYSGVEDITVDEEIPLIDYQNIHINLENSYLSGYNCLLRSLCPIFLVELSLRLTGSEITIDEVLQEAERLKNRDIKSLKLSWQNKILSQNDHSKMIEKIAKLPLKQLKLEMNSNLIKYDEAERWALPQKLISLYLNYENNFMSNTIHNLAASISDQPKLRQLYLNFRNNNLKDIDIKLLFRNISQYSHETLQKLVLNVSMNIIDKPMHTLEYLVETKNKTYFRNIMSLEIRLDECQIKESDFMEIVKGITRYFQSYEDQQSKLKILKLTYDRNTTKKNLQEKLSEIISSNKYLKLNIIPYDNKFFMIYFERKKGQSKISVRKSVIKGISKKNKPSDKPNVVKSICPRLYTKDPSYQSFICLSCIENRQMAKSQFFCKSCIQKCGHRGHNIVRVYENKSCNCTYNFCCQNVSEKIQGQTCGDKQGISYKKRYYCNRCQSNLCQICIKSCYEAHEQWIQVFGSTYFKCMTAINSEKNIY